MVGQAPPATVGGEVLFVQRANRSANRAIVVRQIEPCRLGGTPDGHFYPVVPVIQIDVVGPESLPGYRLSSADSE